MSLLENCIDIMSLLENLPCNTLNRILCVEISKLLEVHPQNCMCLRKRKFIVFFRNAVKIFWHTIRWRSYNRRGIYELETRREPFEARGQRTGSPSNVFVFWMASNCCCWRQQKLSNPTNNFDEKGHVLNACNRNKKYCYFRYFLDFWERKRSRKQAERIAVCFLESVNCLTFAWTSIFKVFIYRKLFWSKMYLLSFLGNGM